MNDDEKNLRIPVMMSASEVAVIDAWRRSRMTYPGRSEVIRRLIELGLRRSQK